MSINLGSAEGHIVIRSDKATKGAQETIRAIRSIEAQAEGSGKGFDRMARSGDQMGRAVSRGAQEAQQGIQMIARTAESAADGLDRMGDTAGVLGGVLVASLGAAGKSAADLQRQIALISTIRPDINVGQVGDQIQAMSTRVAQSTEQLAESLYNVFSSVEVSQEEALRLTEQFAKGAVAARTDAETFGTAILGVMNAYKLEVEDAGHVSDVFFNTINKGVINGEQLASSLGNVAQSAKNAGVNFDTLGALIAGVTKEGGEASVNVNNLGNALQKIVTEDVQKGLADLGIVTKDANGNFRDIVAVLKDLDAVLGRMSQSQRAATLQNLFPDAQARTGIQTLLSQLSFVEQVAKDNASAANVASDAYAKMGSTAAAQGQILRNTLMATLQDMGEILLPNLVGIAEDIRALVTIFNSLPGGVKAGAVEFAALSAILLVIGSGAVKVVSGFQALTTALRAVAAAAGAANVSLGALAARLTLIAAPLILVAKSFEVLFQQSLPSAIANIQKYGDAWGEGREKAHAAFEANKDDLSAVVKLAEEARVKFATLQTEIDFLRSGKQGVNDPGGLFNDPTRLKRLEAEQANLRTYINTLVTLADAEEAAAVAAEQRKRQGIGAGFIGPIATLVGPPVPPGYTQGLVEAERAAAALTPTTREAMAIVAALGGVASETAGGVDELSAAYFENQRAAAGLQAAQDHAASIEALRDRLAGLQSEAQGVTTSVAPLQAALDLLNQKVAAGIPLTSEQQHLLSTLPGYIASATSSYDQLVTAQAQAQIAIQNATAPAGGAGAGFSTLAGDAARLQGALDQLRASAIQLEGAIGALGQENGKLGAQYSILNERIQALNEKKKEGGGLTAQEAQEYKVLEGALGQLGAQMGINAAQQRDLILSQIGVQTQIKETTGQLNAVKGAWANLAPPGDVATGLVGVTSGLGQVATASGPAISGVQGVGTAIAALPSTKTITIDVQTKGADVAKDAAAFFGKDGGGGQTITFTANTSEADTALQAIRDKLTAINDEDVNAQIGATDNATNVANGVTVAIGKIPTAHDTVVTATDLASGVLAGILGAVNSIPRTITIEATANTAGTIAAVNNLRDYMPSSPSKKGAFRTLPDWSSVFKSLEPAGEEANATIRESTTAMARALGDGIDEAADESAGKAADLASKVAAAVNATSEALGRLRTQRLPEPGQFERFRAAMLPILEAFAADGADMAEKAIEEAGKWAEAAAKIFQSVSAGADALAKIADFTRPADEAMLAFRDSAQFLANLMIQIATDSDEQLTEAGAKWAEAAGAIFGAVSVGVDALTKLAGFQRPTDRAAQDFRDISQYLVNLIAEVASEIEDQALHGAQDWADTAHAIFGALGTGVDALTKLRTFERPTDRAAQDFRDVSQYVVNLLAEVASDIEAQALPRAREWSDTADAIFGALANGVDALTGLADFARPTDQAVRSFRDVSQFAVNLIAQVAADIEAEALPGAREWAETADAIFGAIGSGVDALTQLREFERPTDEAVKSFRDVAQYAVNLIAQVGADIESEALPAAEGWAKAAGAIFDAIGSGVEGLSRLADFERPADEALRSFRDVAQLAVNIIAEVAAATDAEMVAGAAKYAEGAGKVLGLIGSGVQTLGKLGEGEFAPPDPAQLARVAEATRQAVIAVAAAAAQIDGDLTDEAAKYAEGAGKAVGLIGQGLGAFKDIATFVPPSAAQIRNLVNVTAETVRRIAEAASAMDKEAVAAAGEYGENGGKAIGVVGATLSAFANLKDFVPPSQKAIDGVVDVAAYAAKRLGEVAQGFDPATLDKIGEFGDDVSSGLGAIRSAMDIGKALQEQGRIKPADAIGAVAKDLADGIGPLDQLVAISEQYATKGATVETNMTRFWASVGASLPGYSAAQAAAAVQVTVGATQTIRHEIAGEVKFAFLGENGQWIVRSLSADDAALTGTTDLIAGKLKPIFEEALGAA